MTSPTPPPPKAPAPAPARSPRRILRDGGLLLALSAPISGLILWSAAATLIGEHRVENASGSSTPLGYVIWAMPAIIGLGIAAWAHFAKDEPTLPGKTAVVGAMIAFGVLATALGLWSITTEPTASIGGGLLALTGAVLAGGGVIVLFGDRRADPP